MSKIDSPEDGTSCCSHEPEFDQEVKERCPKCFHFYTSADGRLKCTWPWCVTNKGSYVCNVCKEDFDLRDDAKLSDGCPFCESENVVLNN